MRSSASDLLSHDFIVKLRSRTPFAPCSDITLFTLFFARHKEPLVMNWIIDACSHTDD